MVTPYHHEALGLRAKREAKALDSQIEDYKKLKGVYPTTEQGLRAIASLPKDPWGSDYFYRSPGKRYSNGYDLFSPGPDRLPDTIDDEWGE